MRYKKGDRVKIISRERFDKMAPEKPKWWNNSNMNAMLGTEQTILKIVKEGIEDGYHITTGGDHTHDYWVISDDAIEGLAGPMDTDMIKAGQEKKVESGPVGAVGFKGPLMAEVLGSHGKIKTPLSIAQDKYRAHEPMTQEERDMVYQSYKNSVSQPVTYGDFYLSYTGYLCGSAKPEMVNHPAHYGGADNPYEAVKVIEAWGLDWHLGSAVKYIARAGKKDPKKTKEDLEKALWYLQRKISLLGILLLFCFSGFSQVDPKLKIDTSGKNTADFIYSVTSGEMLYNVNKNRSYEIWDEAGCWLRWKENSDTLELIKPAKVHYIKIGNKIIRL